MLFLKSECSNPLIPLPFYRRLCFSSSNLISVSHDSDSKLQIRGVANVLLHSSISFCIGVNLIVYSALKFLLSMSWNSSWFYWLITMDSLEWKKAIEVVTQKFYLSFTGPDGNELKMILTVEEDWMPSSSSKCPKSKSSAFASCRYKDCKEQSDVCEHYTFKLKDHRGQYMSIWLKKPELQRADNDMEEFCR